jgi:hypothetical protein
MKTATLWLTLLAALPCATAVIAQFAPGAARQTLSPAPVSDTSMRTIAMASDSVVWGDALPRESGAVRGFSVVWADAVAGGGEWTSFPAER